MVNHTCAFCLHPFIGRRRMFCPTCLPPLGEWDDKSDYQRRYVMLQRACGLFAGGSSFPSSKLPPWPKPAPAPTPLVDLTCEHCRQRFTSENAKRYCSRRCIGRAASRRQKQRRKVASLRSVECVACRTVFTTNHQNQERCTQCVEAWRNRPRLPTGVCRHCGGEADRYVCQACIRVSQREANRRYKALKRGARSGDRYTFRQVAERDKWRCKLCGKPVKRGRDTPWDPEGASIDHRVPVSLGGEDSFANVQLAHFGCNTMKRDRVWGAGEQLGLC